MDPQSLGIWVACLSHLNALIAFVVLPLLQSIRPTLTSYSMRLDAPFLLLRASHCDSDPQISRFQIRFSRDQIFACDLFQCTPSPSHPSLAFSLPRQLSR